MMNRNLPSYNRYTDSGVKLLDKIPSVWRVAKVKSTCSHVRDGTHGSFERVDIGYPLLSVRNIVNSKFVLLSDDSCISEYDYKEISKSLKIKEGDLQLAIVGATLGKVALVPVNMPEFVTQRSLATLRSIAKILYNRFFLYFANSSYFQDALWSKTNYSAQPGIYLSTISNIDIFLPPLSEQKAIADYLDIKTAQIDQKIDLLTQKATQYSKLKQSLINETVTRGLDKTVAMKDSGVEWIGEVPAHWGVKRGKNVFKQTKNKVGMLSSSYDVLSLTLKGVIKRDLDNMKGKIPASFDGYQIANLDNLVLCLFDMDVTPRIVGYINQLGIITSAYTVLRGKNDVHMKYFLYYHLEQNRNGSLLANSKTLRSTMTFDLFSQLQLPVPPFDEQKTIADYLDTKTAHIDRIVETINNQIDKLKELRKTLINDVVTGKIKVAVKGEAV